MDKQTFVAVGKIATLTGPVTVQKADGRIVKLEVGSTLYQGDLVLSGTGGKVGITLSDKSRFALGENAKLRVDELSYNPTEKSGNLAVSIMKGVFMFVTGEIAHLRKGEETMKVHTTNATIGIRGTQVAGEVNSDGSDTRFTLLPNPDGSQSTVVIYNAGGTQVLSENYQSVSTSSFFSPPSAPTSIPQSTVETVYAQALAIMTQVNASLGLPPPGAPAPGDQPATELPGSNSPTREAPQGGPSGGNSNSNTQQLLPIAAQQAPDPTAAQDTARIDPTPQTRSQGVTTPGGAPVDSLAAAALQTSSLADLSAQATITNAPTSATTLQPPASSFVTTSATSNVLASTTSTTTAPATLTPVVILVPTTLIAGTVADGHISGARIYLDLNNNGSVNANEDTGVLTNGSGRFTGATTLSVAHAILATGGVNTDTGLANTLILKAPVGASVINPLTTLTQAFLEAIAGSSVASAGNAVRAAFSLGSIDLLSYDPISAGDASSLPVQKIAASIGSLLTLASANTSADAQTTANAVMAHLVTAVNGGGALDMTNAALLTTLLAGTGSTVTLALVQAAMTSIATATDLSQISAAQLNYLRPGNFAPVATDSTASTGQDTALQGQLTATDLDNVTLTYAQISGPTHGTLTLNANGSYTYTPSTGYIGTDSFSYSANDGRSNSNIATLTLRVNPLLSINDISVNEDAGVAIFTVTLSAASGQTVTLGYNASNGTATADLDFNNTMGTLTFAPGTTSQTVTVPIINDTTAELNETFNINLTGATNASISDALGIGTVIDNDKPTVLSVDSTAASEGSNLTHTVTLSALTAADSVYTFALAGVTATTGTDFASSAAFSNGVTLSSGNITVPTGVSSFTVTYPTLQDTLDEANETISLSVGGVTGTGSITDDDPTPTISINDLTISESGGTAVFTVSLSAPSGQTVTVGYSTSEGTATSSSDYTNASGTLNFAAGQTTQTITVAITDDLLTETSETFEVGLTTPTNATLSVNDAIGTVTITDNENGPAVSSVTNTTAAEGGDLLYNVTLSGFTLANTTYTFALTGVSATAGSDFGNPSFSNGSINYDVVSGQITVPTGISGFTVTIPTTDDTSDEAMETMTLSIGGVTGTGTIIDNDPTPSLSINDVTVGESAGVAVFTVTLSAASGQLVTVGYLTSNGTAVQPGDHTIASGTLTFAAGVTSQTVTVPIINDTTAEASETFTVTLSDVTNATLSDGTGVGTILDNDSTPTIASVSSVSANEGTALVHTVTLSNASSSVTTYVLSLTGGTATAGTDFDATPSFSNGVTISGSTIMVPANVTSFTVSYSTTNDTSFESYETALLSVGGVTASGTIADNDTAASFSLAVLNGSNGFRLDGVTAADAAGAPAVTAGDVNGDGFTDLIVGAYNASPGALTRAGSSYVVFGKADSFSASNSLATLTNGTTGFRLDGSSANDYSGRSVATAGDINGDGFADLIVGASNADPGGLTDSGSSYVVFGKNSSFAATTNLNSLSVSEGFRLDGVAAGDIAGRIVSSAGDINGDGFDDLMIGAYGADNNSRIGSGSIYVVFGKNTTFGSSVALSALDGTTGFRLDGATAGEKAGKVVSRAGDINGDGIDDLIIGAPLAAPNSTFQGGASYVVFGKTSAFGATLDLGTLNGSTGFRIDGVSSYDQSGSSVSAAGDINGDGFADIIVGAVGASGGTVVGAAYIVFGKSAAFSATLALSALDGSNGFLLEGVATGDSTGISVSAAGDVNGDGFGDLIVGAMNADPAGQNNAGSSYVVFGKATPFGATLNLGSLSGIDGFRIDGIAANDASGSSVSAAGDLNGDGFADLIVGAPAADPNGNASGSSYVILGSNFTNSVTNTGSSTGTTGSDRFVGSTGVDVMIGNGGGDSFHAGAGNDTIQLNANNVTSLSVAGALVDGGSGFDTLSLDGTGITLNFQSLVTSGKVTDIEKVNLTGSGNNTLSVTLANVLDLNASHVLLVDGNAGDAIASTGQGWLANNSGSVKVDGTTYTTNASGQVTISGHTYTDYLSGTLGHLLIETTVSGTVS